MSKIKKNDGVDMSELLLQAVSIFSVFGDEPLLPASKVKKFNDKTTTFFKEYQRRKNILKEHGLDKIPSIFPELIKLNIKEAKNCFLMGLDVASYALIIRSFEIAVSHYHKMLFPESTQTNFDRQVKALNNKINMSKTMLNFVKGQYEERNNVLHDVYIPTHLELLTALESSIRYISKLINDSTKIIELHAKN